MKWAIRSRLPIGVVLVAFVVIMAALLFWIAMSLTEQPPRSRSLHLRRDGTYVVSESSKRGRTRWYDAQMNEITWSQSSKAPHGADGPFLLASCSRRRRTSVSWQVVTTVCLTPTARRRQRVALLSAPRQVRGIQAGNTANAWFSRARRISGGEYPLRPEIRCGSSSVLGA